MDMKLILFDLGDTLEHQDVLLPGAIEVLQTVSNLKDSEGHPVLLALLSDFFMPHQPADIPPLRQQYYALLGRLGIDTFFQPLAQFVTLSTEVGVFKPDWLLFQTAIAKAHADLAFSDVLFVTENHAHVQAARILGMHAVHVKGPGQQQGDIDHLLDLIPVIHELFGLRTGRPMSRLSRSVRLGTRTIPRDAEQARIDPTEKLGASWVRLGDRVLLFAQDLQWQARVVEPARAAPGFVDLDRSTPRQNLHLVTQKGRWFQQEHPEVPVLLDSNRYLVVDIPPGNVEGMRAVHGICYSIEPLQDGQIVFAKRIRHGARRAGQARVQAVLDKLSREGYAPLLNYLVAFPTRLSTSSHFQAAATWAREQLSRHYLTHTQVVSVGADHSENVIADKKGTATANRDVIIVCAHLDSINQRGGADAPAPGADDNASGAAGVLHMAEAFADYAGQHDVRFILFGGEEQGLLGSRQYVSQLPTSEQSRIKAVINMDMIGCRNNTTHGVLLEGHLSSQRLIDVLALAAETYTDLEIETSLFPHDSDHVSFINQGIPALLTIEGSDQNNPRVHTDHDTLHDLNYDLILDILRMNTAAVVQLLE
jgi:FMN phosphatase YigB (HAD superfamily)